jgi:hypothetical protein
MNMRSCLRAGFVALVVLGGARTVHAAQVRLLLPLGRTAYQTNETIDVSVARSDARALRAGTLAFTVTGADGSKMGFTFPVRAVPLAGSSARTTENLHVDGWLLRPGSYTVDVTCDGATATTAFTVYSAVRRSTYKTIHWGGKGGDAMLAEGQDGLGFNVLMTGDVLHQEQSIVSGADVMGVELMGGGHQHDLRLSNDWSDPQVYVGAIQRGIDRAFSFRTLPNAIGAHLHDEPGLTWRKNPHTGVFGAQDIPEQRVAYERAFGREALWADRVAVEDPAQYAQWTEQNDFKLGFMDAFWKASNDAIARLKPGYLPVTQSQYAWWALYDGYYFNVARSMPVISGHGGYDDGSLRNLNPSFFVAMALPRQRDKPTWYLPEWFDLTAEQFRLEHNLSFITGIQGLSTPPGITLQSRSAPAVFEANHLFQRIGTIFAVPSHTDQDVAVLYAKSNQYYLKKQDQPGLNEIYAGATLLQYPVDAVLEEDVLDGSLAASRKVVILTGIAHLDAPVVAGLEQFVRDGGSVLETADCGVTIRGAVKLAIDAGALSRAQQDASNLRDPSQKKTEGFRVRRFSYVLAEARRVAAVLAPALKAAGVKPTFVSDVPTIAAAKQVLGDIEYDFAVNFTVGPDDLPENGGLGVPVATSAKIALPDDSRPVYDLGTGKLLPFTHGAGTVAFSPGQMMAFARPVRPVGGVQVGAPVVSRDLTREVEPLRMQITATLVDTQQKLIAGTAPMEVVVTDPRGDVRYDLFRAAERGVLDLHLPLAANDTPGTWTVTVTEFLSGAHGSATFSLRSPAECGAIAGKTARAVVFGDDVPNIYKFFREHRTVTIVPGSGAADAAAATRLVESLRPYTVIATIESLSDAKKPLPLTDAKAATWCGDAASGTLDAAARANPEVVGYNVPGPTILIGNAADNPLIAFLQKRSVLPYALTADFPGAGHGLVAWNLMTLGHDIESLALVGDDAAGIDEAVGTAFQIGIGVDPLTPYALPASSTVSPVKSR